MNVQEGVPSNDAVEDDTGVVPAAIAEAESVGVTELASRLAGEATRVSFPSHRREVEVRGNGAVTVTEPSGGK
ncbi:hypothetical protein HUG10_15240 [Halorarum halophilum]|uniref:Halobacterial output domain-containing protein n=1 Tax=Halorarum halophilum TaxID=2743090 RepID=A0A7D5GJE2_9EURY|nr:hypothetical protein [Halobaculum halophilum]QLG28811.1 hypothetical protein HUG10_15240 [Halobaculum halophilum]